MKLTSEQIKKLEENLTELHQKMNDAGYDDTESELFENVVITGLKDLIEEFET